MATNTRPQGGLIIILSLVIAMVLMLIPLPETARLFRPEWVVMTLIYWAMALPRRVGIVLAWLSGLLMDVMMGSGLGIFAFSYALVVYLVLRFHLQLRQYPLWQQALSIMSLVLLVNIIAVLMTSRVAGWTIWIPAVVSTILWPIIYAALRSVRRNFHVS